MELVHDTAVQETNAKLDKVDERLESIERLLSKGAGKGNRGKGKKGKAMANIMSGNNYSEAIVTGWPRTNPFITADAFVGAVVTCMGRTQVGAARYRAPKPLTPKDCLCGSEIRSHFGSSLFGSRHLAQACSYLVAP